MTTLLVRGLDDRTAAVAEYADGYADFATYAREHGLKLNL